MSGCGCSPIPGPVCMPPLRAGEVDGRYIDASTDLGIVGDKITSIATVAIGIYRADGTAVTGNDLRLAGASLAEHAGRPGLARHGRVLCAAGVRGRAVLADLHGQRNLQGRFVHPRPDHDDHAGHGMKEQLFVEFALAFLVILVASAS